MWTKERVARAHANVIDLQKERERRQELAAVVELYPSQRRRVTAMPAQRGRYLPRTPKDAA